MMLSLSSLLGKSKKQSMFHQAYVISMINNGLEQIQLTSYPSLNLEFEKMERFIVAKAQNIYQIKFRIHDNSFKTFVKTEITNIDLMLRDYLEGKGLDKLQFEIAIT
jgi:hypothetical protein